MSNATHHPMPHIRTNLAVVPSVGRKPKRHKSNRYGSRHARKHQRSARWVAAAMSGLLGDVETFIDTRNLERIRDFLGRGA